MGLLNDHNLSNIFISEMSIHLVGGDKFVPRRKMKLDNVEFFKDRIGDIDDEPVFKFEEDSFLKRSLQDIVDGSSTFEKGAQNISRKFSDGHVSSSVEGAFFVIELRDVTRADCHFYCLIKYDYSEAIEHQDAGSKALLRKIAKAFVADKKTLQKSALIKVEGKTVLSMLSARDRMKRALLLGDYYEKFLGVVRDVSDTELNERALIAVKDVLTHLSGKDKFLPTGGVPQAMRIAKDSISGQPQINEEVILNAIILASGDADDEAKVKEITKVVASKVKTHKIAGLTFNVDSSIFSKPALRRVKTKEGVTITFPDMANNSVVKIINPKNPGGNTIIEITTSKIENDELINERRTS